MHKRPEEGRGAARDLGELHGGVAGAGLWVLGVDWRWCYCESCGSRSGAIVGSAACPTDGPPTTTSRTLELYLAALGRLPAQDGGQDGAELRHGVEGAFVLVCLRVFVLRLVRLVRFRFGFGLVGGPITSEGIKSKHPVEPSTHHPQTNQPHPHTWNGFLLNANDATNVGRSPSAVVTTDTSAVPLPAASSRPAVRSCVVCMCIYLYVIGRSVRPRGKRKRRTKNTTIHIHTYKQNQPTNHIYPPTYLRVHRLAQRRRATPAPGAIGPGSRILRGQRLRVEIAWV